MLIIPLADARAHPRAVMVHLLDADSADITMTGPRRSIYVASHAEFDAADFKSLRYDVGNLYMIFYLLIPRNLQKGTLHLEPFAL